MFSPIRIKVQVQILLFILIFQNIFFAQTKLDSIQPSEISLKDRKVTVKLYSWNFKKVLDKDQARNLKNVNIGNIKKGRYLLILKTPVAVPQSKIVLYNLSKEIPKTALFIIIGKKVFSKSLPSYFWHLKRKRFNKTKNSKRYRSIGLVKVG